MTIDGEFDRVFETQVDEIHHHILPALGFDDLFLLSVAMFINLRFGGIDLIVRQAGGTLLVW